MMNTFKSVEGNRRFPYLLILSMIKTIPVQWRQMIWNFYTTNNCTSNKPARNYNNLYSPGDDIIINRPYLESVSLRMNFSKCVWTVGEPQYKWTTYETNLLIISHTGAVRMNGLVTQREVEYITVATNLNKLIMSRFCSNWLDRKLPLTSHT